MKNLHGYLFASDDELDRLLLEAGVPKVSGQLSLWDDDPRLPAVERILSAVSAHHVIASRYTEEEILSASWARLHANSLTGYPQPQANHRTGWMAATYDMSQCCAACGVGYEQIAPYRMKLRPKWGRNSVMGLNWVFGDVFIERKFYESRLAPLGVAVRDVVLHKSGEVLDNVVQVVPNVDDLAWTPSCLMVYVSCEACGVVAVEQTNHGFFGSVDIEVAGPVVRAATWVKLSSAAFRPLIVSKVVVQEILRVKGGWLHPCGIETV